MKFRVTSVSKYIYHVEAFSLFSGWSWVHTTNNFIDAVDVKELMELGQHPESKYARDALAFMDMLVWLMFGIMGFALIMLLGTWVAQ